MGIVARPYGAEERLEPCAGKLACRVLRGEHASNSVFLPDGKARMPYEFNGMVALHPIAA